MINSFILPLFHGIDGTLSKRPPWGLGNAEMAVEQDIAAAHEERRV